MKKLLKVVGIVVVLLVVVVLVVVSFFLGNVVKTGIETVGPTITKTDMTLEKARIFPLTGKTLIKGLVIGNPEGFKTAQAIKLGRFKLDMVPKSVFSDRIVIKEILIEGPDITYEIGLRGSNIGKITENAQSQAEAAPEKTPAGDKSAEEEKPAEGAGKKVQIDRILIKGGRLRVSSPLLQGLAVPIPLPPIEIKDIGKESDGATIGEVVARVMGAISTGAVTAIKGSGQLAGKGVKLMGDGAMKGAEVAGDAAKMGVDAVGNVAGKGTEVVGGSAKAVGGAAKKGVDSATGLVKGLFGKDKKEPE